jgi:hypothetical protein
MRHSGLGLKTMPVKKSESSRHKVPYGYRREPSGKLSADPVEALIRKKIYALFIEHGRKKMVANLLNATGDKTRDGHPFSDTTIGRLLADPLPTGRLNTPFEVESLVSEEDWDQCQELLKQRPGKTPAHLFSGIVQCECGSKMYVPTRSQNYTCQPCRRAIPVETLNTLFFEQYQSCFLSMPQFDAKETEAVQSWTRFSSKEKRAAVELMVRSIKIGDATILIDLYCLPSAVVISANGQHEQKGNTPGQAKSPPVHQSPFKFNVVTRELFQGPTPLTQKLNETTRNFLTVLALNVTNGIDAPMSLDVPFVEGASASTRSALDTLRRHIGARLCKQIIKTERGSTNRPGGVRLQNVKVVEAGNREVTIDPSTIHAAKADRSGQASRQRKIRT